MKDIDKNKDDDDRNVLARIKSSVESAYNDFSLNFKRYEDDRYFLYINTLDNEDQSLLKSLDKPVLNVNVLGAHVSRLVGEFADMTPMPTVKSSGRIDLIQQIQIVGGHLKAILLTSEYRKVATQIMEEMLSGGFSVMRVSPEYKNNESFDQEIKLSKVYSPILCGFDPMAKEISKRDGNFCYELVPVAMDEFKKMYPEVEISDELYKLPVLQGFQWARTEGKRKELYICEYYEKEKHKKKLVLCSNPESPMQLITMTLGEYRQRKAEYTGLAPFPEIIQRRTIYYNKIRHFKFIGSTILESELTDFDYLPLVFFDGNSHLIKNKQVTRSYITDAKPSQKVKNLALINLVDAFENARRSNVMCPEEAIPQKPEHRLAWANPQQAKSTLFYRSISNGNVPLNKPDFFPSGDINPIYMQLYNNEDKTMQAILGAYDTRAALSQQDVSGESIIESITQSNNAAKPFITNFLISLTQVCHIIVDLMPKYYRTATTIPYVDSKNQHYYIKVNNGDQSTALDFSHNDLDVVVEAGQDYQIQKHRYVKAVLSLIPLLPNFAQMINEKGLPLLLDNFDITNKGQLKEMMVQFLEEKKQQQAQMMKAQASKPPPELIMAQSEMLRAQTDAKKVQDRNAIDQQKVDIERAKVGQEAIKAQADLLLREQQASTEQQRTDAELAISQNEAVVKLAKDLL